MLWRPILTSIKLPQFQTERLLLRGVNTSDIPAYEKHFVDYEVIQHLAVHVPWPYPKDGVAWFLENSIFPTQGQSTWLWGIFQKDNPAELIGAVHLWRESKPENRGFWLGKKFWGKGYMTEAVEPITHYAFNHLSFEKLVFANAVGNLKSRRIKEKTGAKMIAVQPAKFVNPKYTEHEIWELKKSDWEQIKMLNNLPEKTIHDTIWIQAEPARVFQALTSGDELIKWFPEIKAEIILKVGGDIYMEWSNGGILKSKVKTFVLNEEISYGFYGGDKEPVTFKLVPEKNGTRLNLTHFIPSGGNLDQYIDIASNWAHLLTGLKCWVEKNWDIR